MRCTLLLFYKKLTNKHLLSDVYSSGKIYAKERVGHPSDDICKIYGIETDSYRAAFREE